ncbi:MAG: asparagine synthase (glutamine-hydrolyzing) [Patescibacteria group bacterium]
MCGFAGFVGMPDADLLGRMEERVRHRGPDQDGRLETAGCSLAHKRLSIIDLSEAGRQPMTTPDGRFTVAYNGEIYNYRELRTRYAAEGWTFRTQTDTECLLASASLHGLRDLGSFHGIFAFALWDRQSRTCFLARDRMGIKPLFVADAIDGRRGFASEIGVLLELKARWQEDTAARASFLAVGYVPGPATIFRGIASLEPGVLHALKDAGLSVVFDLKEPARLQVDIPSAETSERLRRIVDCAVANQLVSDRPVGVFLSGGLDSSVVLSSMRLAQPSGAIKTFTTRFKHNVADPKFNRDAELARLTAERWGCDHHEIEIGPEDVIREADAMAVHLGQPHANHSVVALDAAARLAAPHVPVVLSGDGGDESFGGYDRYRRVAAVAGLLANPRSRSVIQRLVRLHPRGEAWHDLVSAEREAGRLLSFHAPPLALRRTLFGEAADDRPVIARWEELLAATNTTDPVGRFMALDRMAWLRDDAFVRSDRLTMRHGLELRVPLTDDAVVAFAAGIRRSLHVDAFRTKKLWRATFADRCLPEVVSEPKRGWFPPHAKWLRDGLTEWSRDIIEDAIVTHAWMDGQAIRAAFEDHLAKRAYHLQEIWTVVSYHLWWKAHRDRLV